MKLFVAIFLATLSLVATQSSSDDWKCGNGPVTSRASFLLAGHFAKSDGMDFRNNRGVYIYQMKYGVK